MNETKSNRPWVLYSGIIGIALLVGLAACDQRAPSPTPTSEPLPTEIILYDWAGYMPQSVIDAFTEEYGIAVRYIVYETQEEAEASLRAGNVYDVVVMGNDFIARLIADGLLAPIDYRYIPNFKNISANFRDLAYDPGNKYSILIQWSTTGLVVRQDLVDAPITRWADLWEPRYAGKVGVWAIPRLLTGITLKSLGHSLNSEDPQELEAALQQLLKLKGQAFFMDLNLPNSVPFLLDGQAVMTIGWPFDALAAREQSDQVIYILPEEGTVLWGDNVVIPANSPRKRAAERFIDFLLRPQISAEIVNNIYIPSPNEAARPFIDPEILNDPVIYPPEVDLQNAEIILPLSDEGVRQHDRVWQQFMKAWME